MVLCLLLGSTHTIAQKETPEIAAIKQFFTAQSIDAGWFADSFLAQVPASQLMPVRQQVTAAMGAFKTVEPDPDGQNYRAVFEKGYVPTSISLDEEGKINGLFLRPPVPQTSSLDEAAANFAALAGDVALLVTRNGEVLHELNADMPLAVGSAFKLSILAALMADVEAGKHRWADVVELQDSDRSLPSGTLRSWPAGAPITLYALAGRMISESDNTATDALLHALGRGAVEAHAPARNQPFLSTREAFALKNPDNADHADRFLAGDLTSKRAVLEGAGALPMPGAAVFSSGATVRPEIEWFYSARELCEVMGQVASAEVTQINNGGIASAKQWVTVSYKGGSEPGVLNQTYWLTDQKDNEYCVAATRNDVTPFDQNSLISPVNGLISLLAE
jgi:beta-lactamase class A